MGLSEFLLSGRAVYGHELDDVVKSGRRFRRTHRRFSKETSKRLDALEHDVGYLTLVLGTLLAKANDKGLVTLDEIRGTLGELDEVDGVRDGRLSVEVLRDLASGVGGADDA
ncbi:hypothetical protein [Engelhardtia mirabilis]|uniref:EF-hand domain-containing protein n=1 Tax=Engelhardtia mirabilis TaxID=2528011 RepID=A0A518BNI0_9BACT|nr:hypothetical protein Pla133_36320 [Planctomycetes bacterium Pla133]QDV02859.1 hypothetical protein Pla86_36300 [Planctomycetes bacterium Pla86]